jgi:hypothetical protein
MTTLATGGIGSIGSPATVTANSSPSDIANTLNWSLGAVPIATDNVVIDNSSVPLLWNLSTLSGVALNSLTITSTFTGTIGLPEQNTNGSQPYEEYRPAFMQQNAATITIGTGTGSGSGRIKLDNQAVTTTLIVLSTGQPLDTNLESVLWKGTGAGNAVTVDSGSVGIAVFGNETSTVPTLNVNSGAVRCGAGVTLTSVTTYGGTLVTNSGATTLKQYGGNTVVYSGNITTLSVISGTAQYGGAGTITTLTVSTGGTIDFSIDPRAKTVTNCSLYSGSALSDPLGSVTFSNPVALVNCTVGDVGLNLRRNFTLAIVYV